MADLRNRLSLPTKNNILDGLNFSAGPNAASLGITGFKQEQKSPLGLDLGTGHAAVRFTPGAKGKFKPSDITLSTGKADIAAAARMNEEMNKPMREEEKKKAQAAANKKTAENKKKAEEEAAAKEKPNAPEGSAPDEADFTKEELAYQNAEAEKLREIQEGLSNGTYTDLGNAYKGPDGKVHSYVQDSNGNVWHYAINQQGQFEKGSLQDMSHGHAYDDTYRPNTGYYDDIYGKTTTRDDAGYQNAQNDWQKKQDDYANAQSAYDREQNSILNGYERAKSTYISPPMGGWLSTDIMNGTPGTRNLLKGVTGRLF